MGHEVGYTIRFDDCSDPHATRIKVQRSIRTSGYHENSIFTCYYIALCYSAMLLSYSVFTLIYIVASVYIPFVFTLLLWFLLLYVTLLCNSNFYITLHLLYNALLLVLLHFFTLPYITLHDFTLLCIAFWHFVILFSVALHYIAFC